MNPSAPPHLALAAMAQHAPDRIALRYLGRAAEPRIWRYGELDHEIRALAARMTERLQPGDRVLLLMPGEPAFIIGFFATLWLGAIPVPVNLPAAAQFNRVRDRLTPLVADCQPALALVSNAVAAVIAAHGGIAVPTLVADASAPTDTHREIAPVGASGDICYLQYSSGSTGQPKGVINTFASLAAQFEILRAMRADDSAIHYASWLPLYHDMGMVAATLLPLSTGGCCTYMLPQTFAADPACWLQAVSDYRANWISGPDFAFVRSIDAFANPAALDLSCLRRAVNGAEPIRAATMERFAAHFAAAGFDAQALTPAYGMAEAGLCITSSRQGWVSRRFDSAALASGVALPNPTAGGTTLVSSGDQLASWQLVIVDPERCEALAPNRVGEIWVHGPSAAAGYWHRPEESGASFNARLATPGAASEMAYLRTGDLGFLHEGQLYVVGRLKDLIIVHGANHAPNDIEHLLERELSDVAIGSACATQLASGDVVAIIEVERRLASARRRALAAAVADTVFEQTGLALADVALVPRGALLRTSSGKLRRQACGQALERGEMRSLDPPHATPAHAAALTDDGMHTLFSKLHDSLATLLGRGPLPADSGFAALGLDSLRAVQWQQILQATLDRPVPLALLYRHSSLMRLSQALTAASNDTPPEATTAVSLPMHAEPIAIIGVGLRMPPDHQDFDGFADWLLQSRSAVRAAPPQRHVDGVGLDAVAAYLDDVDGFDAEFFAMRVAEAEATDPQQRLVLETAWRALEHGGIPLSRIGGRAVGIFVGQGSNDYSTLPLRCGRPDWARAWYALGNSMSSSAGRAAWFLGTQGPAMVIDTACSSSLVAIDAACRHLRDGSCEMALAGGVNLALSPLVQASLQAAGMLSPHGRCATFSADADGYVRGEGAIMLLLKPQSAAQRDGDRILALIRSSAVMQDGASSGLTVPNPAAQGALLRRAWHAAGLPADGSALDAIELHGTGTPIGDLLEYHALADACPAPRAAPLLLGSIKSQVGHLEAAAGAAGVLRALVALRSGRWPGSPTLSEQPAALADGRLPYIFDRASHALPSAQRPHVIGVSSFGFNGTIAHLVLASAPEQPTPSATRWHGNLPLAAASADALQAIARQLTERLEANYADAAALLNAWRSRGNHHWPWRAVATADTPQAMAQALRAIVAQRCPPRPSAGSAAEGESDRIRRFLAGEAVDWAAADALPAPHRDLPAHPFQRRRHWYPVQAQAESVAVGGGTSDFSLNGLRQTVARCLGVAADAIDDNVDLFSLGLESLQLMDWVDLWRSQGRHVSLPDLMHNATLAGWHALLQAAASTAETLQPAAPLDHVAAGDDQDETAAFPLTAVQHAYLVGRASTLPLSGVSCHVYAEIAGDGLDPQRLETAVRLLIARHGMLRARFGDDGTQRIDHYDRWPGLTVHDWRQHDDQAQSEALHTLRAALSHRLFDLAREPGFDFQLAQLASGGHRLFVNIDMLIADALSIEILLRELALAYRDPHALAPAPRYSFRRYLADQLPIALAARSTARDYWMACLDDLPAPPSLPLAADPASLSQPRFTRRTARLKQADWAALREAARRAGVTPTMTLLTSFASILAAWSNQPRLLVNVPLFNRQRGHADTPGLIADFTTLLALAVELSPGRNHGEQIRAVQQRFLEDSEHRAFSGIEVIREKARREPGFLAPVVFTGNLGRDFLGSEVRTTLGQHDWGLSQTPQVWLDHQVHEQDGELVWNWDAVEALFPPGVLDAMFAAYHALLLRLARDDAAWHAPLPPLLPDTQRAVRERVNATAKPLPDGLLHAPFFAQAHRQPDAIALLGPDGQLSYGALALHARRGAQALLATGVQAGDPVGVCLPRGFAQITAVLACLAAGAVYVPIACDHPPPRRHAIARNAGIQRIVSTLDDWPASIGRLTPEALAAAPPLESLAPRQPDDLAYLIFTSGSTGEPKGVEISHRAALNTVLDINARFAVTPNDRGLALSALHFDLSVYDIFGLLAAGGSLVLIDEGHTREPQQWLQAAMTHQVTLWNSVPALLDMLLTHLEACAVEAPALRLVLLSGDWIGLDLPARLAAVCGAAQLVSLGGATEAAIWSNTHVVTEVPAHWKSIPYGRPLANQRFRVVDAWGHDCPDFVAGELWIGGAGVARGYRNEPERSALRFPLDAEGQRWYRTGDLGRYWPDGTLEFLGRDDLQVKIGGHRIELGEIDAALKRQPAVRDAVTVVVGSRQAQRLVACYVAATPLSDTALRAGLRQLLPDYALPGKFLALETLPLTANGKVDRAALASLASAADAHAESAGTPPQGQTERALAELWCALLEMPIRDREQSFIALGGNSLLAVRLVDSLRQRFDIELSLRDFLTHPTIARLGALVDQRRTEFERGEI